MRVQGIGPIEKWVDDHIFFHICHSHLANYNKSRQVWRNAIRQSGLITTGSRIWFKGQSYMDGSFDEFNEDCIFQIMDLSCESPRSAHDQLFTYNFDDIDKLSDTLGIPWENPKTSPLIQAPSTSAFYGTLPTNVSLLVPGKLRSTYQRSKPG